MTVLSAAVADATALSSEAAHRTLPIVDLCNSPADEQIFPVYGRNAWKSRLRAHPDVATPHGYVG